MHGLTLKSVGPSLLLLLIVLAALALRLHGINWDEGYGFHPDERDIYMRAGCMYDVLTQAPRYRDCVRDHPETVPGLPGPSVLLDAERSPLNPHWFPLGSGLIYVLVFFRSIIELFTDVTDLDMRYVGRTLSALADVGTVLLVYVLGRRMYSRGVGLLAAALTALAVVHIQNSHFYRPETFSLLFTLASFWAMLRLVEHGGWRRSALLGLLVGLSMAPKVSGLPLVLPVALAYGYRMLDSVKSPLAPLSQRGGGGDFTPQAIGKMLAQAALAGMVALVVFFATMPYALLDFRAFLGDVAAQANMARHAGLWPFTVQYVDTRPFLYQFQQIAVWGLGLPLGAVAWLGIPFTAAIALRRRGTRRADLLLLVWVVPSLLLLESFEVRFQRYLFPLMPLMVLMGARMLLWLVSISRAWPRSHEDSERINSVALRLSGSSQALRWGATTLVVIVVGSTAFYAIAFQRIYAQPHPAVAASRWIKANVPPGTVIVSDNHWDEFIPDLHRYNVWQFPVYEPDTPAKMRTLAGHLARAEYVAFYSNRPYGSVARVPERYPRSANYYRELFQGNLGYRLERTFTSYPGLLGVSFQDDPFRRAGLPRPEPLVPGQSPPLAFNLGYADDNVIGYDHPQVLLFRNVDKLPEHILGRRLAGPEAEPRADTRIGLMLSAEALAIQRKGGTWSDIIHRDSWTNRMPVLTWLLVVELVYLAALPLAMFVFRPLPDRGIILARVLGLLVIAYVTWLVVSLGWLTFSRASILLGFLALASLSALVLAARWREIKGFLAGHWRLLLLGEGLFLVAFLAFAAIRAANPDLWHPFRGGEKPMELAYLNAVVRSSLMPPYDPWFAGGYLNYYYWGYFVLAVPVKLTGILPTTAFNLAVPLFFALTVTSAYSLVYNLAAGTMRSRTGHPSGLEPPSPLTGVGARHASPVQDGGAPIGELLRGKVPWGPVGAGLAAGVLTAVIGNLDGAVQLVQGAWHKVVNGQSFPAFDFWRSSRMVPELEGFDPSPLAFWVPDQVATVTEKSSHITEFPFFTFLFADLHAHLMAIPFALLVIGLGLSLVVGGRTARWWWLAAASAMLALALGALWVINSWDYPSYLLLTLALLALTVLLRPGPALWKLLLWAALGSGVIALSFLAFLPFHQAYETFDTGLEASKWRTPIDRYLAIHGLFLFITATFLMYHSRRTLAQLQGAISKLPRLLAVPRTAHGSTLRRSSGQASSPRWFDRLTMSGYPLILSGYPLTLSLSKGRPEPVEGRLKRLLKQLLRALAPRHWTLALTWRRVALGLGVLLVVYLATSGYWTAALLVAFLALAALAARNVLASDAPERSFTAVALALLGLALAIGIGVELVRLKGDIGRMNTFFKLYLGAWVLYSLAAGYMLWYLGSRGFFRLRGLTWQRGLWLGALALLIGVSLIYTVLGTHDRLADRFQVGPPTLDGAAYMQEAVHREDGRLVELKWDLEAIRWLQDHAIGSPVVLEGHHEQYHWSARIASYTGLPTVLGWPWHQIQQRAAYEQAVRDRAAVVREIYNTPSLSRAEELLRQHQVVYIVVGELERVYYSREGLDKFEEMAKEGLLKPVFRNEGVQIYQTVR